MVTLAEIAQRAGVSTIIASRVLNGGVVYKRMKSIACAEKIRGLADEMGYRPNVAAQSIRSGRLGMIGLLLSSQSFRSLLPPEILNGILSVIAGRDLHLLFGHVSDQQLSGARKLPKMLSARTCDGLLINYNADIPERLEELAAHARIPTVWMNSKHACNCIFPDDLGASKTLVKNLIAAGHTRIAYADYQIPNTRRAMHYSNAERFGGYEQTMLKHGLTPRRVDTDYIMDRNSRVSHSATWLVRKDAPTAVICYSHHTAEAISNASWRLCENSQIKKRTAIFAFDAFCPDDEPYDWSVVEIPMNQMGLEATKLLLSLIKNPLQKAKPIALPFKQPVVKSHRINANGHE